MATGQLNQSVRGGSIQELNGLGQSFNRMAQQLQESFTTLAQTNEQLEQRVTERTLELESANQELQNLVHQDGLTQVANRRYFDQYLEQEWQRQTRENQPLSLILCDIDFFKDYNDYYGHPMGDRCLQQIAQAIQKAIKRPADLVARYGGEEFAIILPNTTLEGALQVAERIQHSVAELAIAHQASSVSTVVTVSMGISHHFHNAGGTAEALIHAADQGLYAAKARGRNTYSIGENESC
jgi:diguanylate cyclase (GGDEF)-like protein